MTQIIKMYTYYEHADDKSYYRKKLSDVEAAEVTTLQEEKEYWNILKNIKLCVYNDCSDGHIDNNWIENFT